MRVKKRSFISEMTKYKIYINEKSTVDVTWKFWFEVEANNLKEAFIEAEYADWFGKNAQSEKDEDCIECYETKCEITLPDESTRIIEIPFDEDEYDEEFGDESPAAPVYKTVDIWE